MRRSDIYRFSSIFTEGVGSTLGLALLGQDCINRHFIAINISSAGQALLSFCLLTFTFLSLIISGSGLDEQLNPHLQQYLDVACYCDAISNYHINNDTLFQLQD